MIEAMSVSAVISTRTIPGGHMPDPSRVEFFHDLAERSRRCITTVASHITGAPIGLDIRIPHGKSDQLRVTFKLSVSRSFVGQGLIHGWADCLSSESALTMHLLRKILVEQEFTADEASQFISKAKAASTSLVWNIDMQSRVAALDLLERLARQVNVLRNHNDDDCYGVQNHVFVNTTTEVSLQIILGCGNGIKMSIQPDFLSTYVDQLAVSNVSTSEILTMTNAHIRVEATIGRVMLDELGNGSPAGWTSASLESCIDAVWAEAGLMTPYMPDPAMLNTKGYPPEARAMHKWYLQYQGLDEHYENVLCDMFIRCGYDLQLRQDGPMLSEGFDGEQLPNFFTLLRQDGVDLRVRPSEHKFLDRTIGKALHRSNRWTLPEELLGWIVSTYTEPGLVLALAKVHHPPRQEY
jgi:hypothetical protein